MDLRAHEQQRQCLEPRPETGRWSSAVLWCLFAEVSGAALVQHSFCFGTVRVNSTRQNLDPSIPGHLHRAADTGMAYATHYDGRQVLDQFLWLSYAPRLWELICAASGS